MTSVPRKLTRGEYVEWLRLLVHEKRLLSSERVRAALGCFALAQEHHHAIVLLSEHRLFGAAFALVRVGFEAYIRGQWLSLSATDEDVALFIRGEEPPKLGTLLKAIEETAGFEEQVLSKIKANHWRTLCAYTHSGGLHVQRWQTEEAVEPNYSPAEVEEMLNFAENIGSVAALAILGLADDLSGANQVLEHFRRRNQ